MTQVLDYSLARPAPSAIKAAGYVGVLRYLAPAEDAPKVIYQAEYAALRAAGLAVCLNWEWYANRSREGAAAGTADAKEALAQANALAYRGCIYFSVDYDAPESDQANINAYFEAAAKVLGLARLGAYAGYWPLSRLFDAGLISFGWQTLAWSWGSRESRAHIYQNGAQALGACDVNDVLKPNWAGGSMTPTGWNDTNGELHNPQNAFVVAEPFRTFVLGQAWNANNVPLEDQHEQSPLEASNPSLGDGKQQVFRLGTLEWIAARGVFVAYIGQEFLKLRAELAAAPTPAPVAPSKGDLLLEALKAALE